MDSGNSGSMQSSSGGEEEYDSRTESISSFLNPSAHFGSISGPQAPPQSVLLAQQPPTLFNPHSQNLDVFPQSLANPSGNTTTQYSNDLVWSRGLRSEANYGNFGNVTGLSSSSSSSSSSQSVVGVQGLSNIQSPFATSSSAMPSQENAATLQSEQPNVVKNPKKRTRASRRAPTTVLTTDTTNFRQMVQEFTGIPTAPFSGGSPYSRRLDLFSSTGSSNMRSTGHLDSLGPLYPLRPSAQKVHLSPFVQSSSSPLLNSSMLGGSGTSNTVMPSDHLGLPKQPQNLLNMQNQMLSFQPLLQASSLHPSLKHPSSVAAGKSPANTSVHSFDDLGLGHENVNANLSGFPASLSSAGGQENLGVSSTFDGNKVNSSQQHLGSYKFNCSGSTSEFHHDKGLENVTSGGEGTVGSWICPSD